MVHLLRVVAMCLAVLSLHAHALVPKATQYWVQGSPNLTASTPEAACAAAFNVWAPDQIYDTDKTYAFVAPSTCAYRGKYSSGQPYQYSLVIESAGACPANSTPSGSACQCSSGYSEAGGACVVNNDHAQQCFTFSGIETLSGGVLAGDVALKGDVAHGANFCYPLADAPGKGCTVTFSRGSMATWSDGSKVSYGTYSMTPATKTFGNNQPDFSCGSNAANTPTPNTTSTGEKCSGYVGTVNGVESCIPGTNGATGVDITGGSSTTTNSDGSGSNSSNATTCTATTCTTTTTTTTTNTTGSSSTSTSTTTQSRDDFCRGSGASTAACTGAAEGKAACEKNPMSAGCGGAPVGIQARDFYTPKGKTIGDSLNAAKDKLQASPIGGAMTGFFVVSGSGSCPIWTWVVPFFDKTVVVDAFCQAWVTQALAVMRIAVLLAASFIAFRIAVE